MANDAPGPIDDFTLTNNQTGEIWPLSSVQGSVGPGVIDIQKLYAQTGYFTYDPGYTSTGSCESKITYIDGEQGVLLQSRLRDR